jgi:hypothetical protein
LVRASDAKTCYHNPIRWVPIKRSTCRTYNL